MLKHQHISAQLAIKTYIYLYIYKFVKNVCTCDTNKDELDANNITYFAFQMSRLSEADGGKRVWRPISIRLFVFLEQSWQTSVIDRTSGHRLCTGDLSRSTILFGDCGVKRAAEQVRRLAAPIPRRTERKWRTKIARQSNDQVRRHCAGY